MDRIVKNDRLLESKISIPRILRFYVKREALDRRLRAFENAQEKALVLNAGAGFGKTMLLSHYAAEMEKGRCAWYNLDQMDNNLVSFAEYLTSSIQRTVPDFQFSVNACLEDSQPSAVSLAYDFAVALMNAPVKRLFIILDDFQEISSEEVMIFLSGLMDNTGEHIKFLIATKTAFPNFLMRYYYNGSVEIIDTEQLSFTREEIGELLCQTPNIKEKDQCAIVLAEYSEGWPVGVVSVLLRANQRRNATGAEEMKQLCSECPANNYLMYEVFRKLPYNIQQFLTDTSVLTVISADLCNAVLGISNARATLDYLVRENLFVMNLGGSGNIYRYHSLFQAYLTEQLSQSRKTEICRRAGAWCLRKGMNEQAAEYGLEADDFDLIQLALERWSLETPLWHERIDLPRWQACLEAHRPEWNASTTELMARLSQIKGDSFKGREPAEQEKQDGNDGGREEKQPRLLEVHCFGEFYVKIEGSRRIIRWRTKKARELFAFLFNRQGKEVSKDVITEALWPDTGADSVSTLFYTTVSYMRKGLANEGYTDVIQQKNRMYSLNMSCLVSPRERLEQLASSQEPPGSGELATDLYQGPYLQEIQGDWFVLEREYYERLFLQVCRMQAGALLEQKRYQEGIAVLSGAVAVDEYDEQLAAMLIQCYGMAGDMKNARRQFERTEKLIEEEMGMEVGEGLRAAYRDAAARCGKLAQQAPAPGLCAD